MKKVKNFTLIELLVVIGIIGILATIVIPAVGNALADAKRTSAQAACKSFEESIYQSDTKYNNKVKNAFNEIKDDENISRQKTILKVLAGKIDIENNGDETENKGSTEEGVWGEWEIELAANSKFYESLVDPGFYELDDEGKVQFYTEDGGWPAIVENKFGIRHQLTYRTPEDNGTVEVLHPSNQNKVFEVKGVKRFASPVRVVTWDDEEPAKFITRDGAFRLYTDKSCKTPLTAEGWRSGTSPVYIDNK
jgi:prepilin-type N-terminal cleavage/methylation domain-containing protein